MKLKLFPLLIGFLFGNLTVQAQSPYKEFGIEVEPLTLSKGKYMEFFTNDSLVRIGSVILDTRNNRIASFVVLDTAYSEATLEPEVTSRFLSPDPHAASYPGLSPYTYVANNPLIYIDPTGMDIWTYDQDGNLVSYEANDEIHEVYTQTMIDDEVQNTLIGSGLDFTTEFHELVGTVYAESGGNLSESAAIADVIFNRSEYSGKSLTDIVQNTGIYGNTTPSGEKSPLFLEYQEKKNATGNINQNNAILGVLDAYMGNKDHSQGAYFWEARSELTKSGNWFVRKGFGNKPNANGVTNYLITVELGATVFMMNNPKIHGKRKWP